jgi:hypothetical protein
MDWEQYFRTAVPYVRRSSDGRPSLQTRWGFGTVAGYYTIAELKDLIAAKDATIRNLLAEYDEVRDKPLDFTTFLSSLQNLLIRYQNAKAAAQIVIDEAKNAWRPDNMVIADNEYRAILAACNPRWNEYTWSSGDGSLEDLFDQVRNFGSTGKNSEPIPQPSKGSDVDFETLRETSKFTEQLESTANYFDTKHLIVYAVVGGAVILFLLPKLMGATPIGIIARR